MYLPETGIQAWWEKFVKFYLLRYAVSHDVDDKSNENVYLLYMLPGTGLLLSLIIFACENCKLWLTFICYNILFVNFTRKREACNPAVASTEILIIHVQTFRLDS